LAVIETMEPLLMVLVIVPYVGMAYCAYKALELVIFFYTIFLRPSKNLNKLGEWSVVTGATDGIGKAIAMELAKRGQNVVLISRTQAKLDKCADEIRAATKQDVKTIAIDYSNFDKEKQDKVMEVCADLDIGCLVNNVGMSYEYPEFFEEVPMDRLEKICMINNHALVAMTRLLTPQMVANKRGTVVNMSSVGGVMPHTLMVVYGSSKAFVNNFTTNMQSEMGSKGVTFSAQMPMYVVSNMSKIRRSSLTVPTPETYAKYAVNHFGHSGILSPHPVHALYAGFLQQLPWFLLDMIIDNVHKSIRKKALKKKARAAKKQ